MAQIGGPWLPLVRSANIRSRSRREASNHARRISTQCGCYHRNQGSFSLCLWIPRHRFASSRFNTVILLFLRLFYQASSFEVVESGIQKKHSVAQASSWAFSTHPDRNFHGRSPQDAKTTSVDVFLTYQRVSTTDWLQKILEHQRQFASCRVVSLTWVKALASPFSHEFIQFIVEDSNSGQRTRLAVGREETGDWVICGWDWASGEPPSHHYTLPLPLLSLTFDERRRPDLESLGCILASISERRPGYNLVKEMCWWYAETVFEEVYAGFGGTIKEWQWSRYRYSFIVKTALLRRKVLTKHAELFKKTIAREMEF